MDLTIAGSKVPRIDTQLKRASEDVLRSWNSSRQVHGFANARRVKGASTVEKPTS